MTEKKLVTIYHPTLDRSREVAASKVKEWKDAGWLDKKPSATSDN